MSYFWLHALLPLILYNIHKLLVFLSTWIPERFMLDATTFLWDASTDVPQLCQFLVLGLSSCTNFNFRSCHIELIFILADCHCTPTILQDLPCCYFWILLHRMWHPQNIFLHHIPYIYFWPTINSPVALPSTVVIFSVKSAFYFILVSLSPSIGCSVDIFHNSCSFYWRNCFCFAFFLQHLVLEKSLQALVFLVYWFGLNMFYRTNKFLSWGTCIEYLRYSHCKILSQVSIILVGDQIHVTPSHFHLSHILSWFYWS